MPVVRISDYNSGPSMFQFLATMQVSCFPLHRRHVLRRLATLATITAAATLPQAVHSQTEILESNERPNIVFILADDLGWSDLGCYGSTFYETPHLDRLAAAGMRFTSAYAACPVCSPTRSSLLTGKYPARNNLTEWIPGVFYPYEKFLPGNHALNMALEEVTIAEALREAGYATGLVGKWHLGRDAKHHPSQQGFDVVVDGTPGQPRTYFSPYQNPSLPDGPSGEYLTDRQTQEAVTFIEQHHKQTFYLYLAYNAVHTSAQTDARVQGKPAHVEKYREKMKTDRSQKNETYAAMIHSLDEGVGQIVAKLDELSLAERTIVIFFSDNGGYEKYTNNTPLRGGKGVLYEGGIRVPLIVNWPAVVRPGSTCEQPVTSVDFYPTLLAVCGAVGDPDHNRQLDGISLVPLWNDPQSELPREAIYWHYPHYYEHLQSSPHSAMRAGKYKLIEFQADNHIELYDLAADLGERHNLAAEVPDQANELRQRLSDWLRRVDAQMARPNSAYDPDPERRYQGRRSFFALEKEVGR